MAKQRRPCPRGLYEGCPIPRELCTEDHVQTGVWHCLRFLKDLEGFLFETEEDSERTEFGCLPVDPADEEVTSLEQLLRILEAEE